MIIKKSQLVASCRGVSIASNKHERFRLDMLAQDTRLGYKRLLKFSGIVLGREIRDTVELSSNEISLILDTLKKKTWNEIEEMRNDSQKRSTR